MPISLFDAQCGFGGYAKGVREVVTAEQCLAELERVGIGRALVRTAPTGMDHHVAESNAALYAACQQHVVLAACPVVVPSGGGDFPDEAAQVDDLIAHGAAAACLRPQLDLWSTADWSGGRLLRALEARKVPVFCSHRQTPIAEVAGIAERHPQLPIVLGELDYGSHRLLGGLMEAFKNVHVSLGEAYAVHRGIEDLVRRFGAGRLLFGSGFPEVVPMMSVCQLMYAEISDEQKEMIGSANLQRLMEEIRP